MTEGSVHVQSYSANASRSRPCWRTIEEKSRFVDLRDTLRVPGVVLTNASVLPPMRENLVQLTQSQRDINPAAVSYVI